MRYRWVFCTGLGIGFVLGTRAGRERYEQMRRVARKIADNPTVQQAAGALQAQAASYAKSAGGKLADGAVAAKTKVGGVLQERVPGLRARDSNGRADSNGPEQYVPVPGTPGGQPGG